MFIHALKSVLYWLVYIDLTHPPPPPPPPPPPQCRIYASANRTSIGSDNGLSPFRLHYEQCWVIINWTLRNKLHSKTFHSKKASKNVACEMSAISSRGRLIKMPRVACVSQLHSKSQLKYYNIVTQCTDATRQMPVWNKWFTDTRTSWDPIQFKDGLPVQWILLLR